MANPFFSHGNREALEQVKGLRLAKITSVDTYDMVAEIEFLEESSGKTRVPIPMPMSYPGGGIFSIPKKGAIVLVGIRAMQMPMIISFYPFNAFTPDSNYAVMKQVFGMPDTLSEGDVFLRAASESAKCATCLVVSTLAAWEAGLDHTTLIERCPNCEAPAHTVDQSGKIATLNKQQLGMTLHMRSDGKLFFQGDNLCDRSEGDTQRLIKGVIDGVTGNVTLTDANDIVVDANGDSRLTCSTESTVALKAIEQSSNSRVENVNEDSIENVLNKTIAAADTILMTAQTLTLRAAGIMDRSADSLIESVAADHTYVAGSLSASTSGDREWVVGTPLLPANDFETISGNKTVIIGGDLGETITGGITLTVTGAQTVTVTGDHLSTFGGTWSITATGAISLTSSAQASITGTTVVLNGGVKAVARQDDATLISNLTDPTFMTFLSGLQAILTDLQTVYNLHTHISAAPGVPTGPTNAPSTASVPAPPATVTGKINAGNNTVLA